jgi:hypothetical protein
MDDIWLQPKSKGREITTFMKRERHVKSMVHQNIFLLFVAKIKENYLLSVISIIEDRILILVINEK